MRWRKLGRIFAPDHVSDWMVSHASNGIAELIEGDRFRVLFGCRDSLNRTHVGAMDIDIRQPERIITVSKEPLLSPGGLGTFDDSGTSVGCLATVGGKRCLYYVGWNLGVTVPWRNSIGVAAYDTTRGIFQRLSLAPIVDRSEVDPYSLSYPFVVEENGTYRMWYGSHAAWNLEGRKAPFFHVVKYAESDDGLSWRREGIICIDLKGEDECGISRPCVLRDGSLYKMWYSYRGDAYRIGYAESLDGVHWTRKDEEAGIDVSKTGWDSEMIEYPFVFDHNGNRYMLYNGNGYGKTGIGLAISEGE